MLTATLWAIALAVAIIALEVVERRERKIRERKWHKTKKTIPHTENIQERKVEGADGTTRTKNTADD